MWKGAGNAIPLENVRASQQSRLINCSLHTRGRRITTTARFYHSFLQHGRRMCSVRYICVQVAANVWMATKSSGLALNTVQRSENMNSAFRCSDKNQRNFENFAQKFSPLGTCSLVNVESRSVGRFHEKKKEFLARNPRSTCTCNS